MIAFGFTISCILAKGSNVKDATLDFSDDLTVITGLSNTGKTYIFQCIKYLLGSEELPKKINESSGYEYVYLELKLRNGSYNTICRSLLGGGAHLYLCRVCDVDTYLDEPEHLSIKSTKNSKKRTLSDYYASLCGFEGKRVRKNADGVTEKMGFALMRHLSVIDEVDIIKEESPILSNQVIYETKEKSFLRFLLTGIDDSSIVAKPKQTVISNKKGKLEVVSAFLDECRLELNDLPKQTKADIDCQIDKLGIAIRNIENELMFLLKSVELVELEVNENWLEWKNKESRLLNVEELLIRFNLLSQHYDTDIIRLEAINEAGKAFSHLAINNCPICKSSFADDYLCSASDVHDVVIASESEITKIQRLKNDLQYNIDSLTHEGMVLRKEIETIKERHKQAQESANYYRSVEISKKIKLKDQLQRKLIDVAQFKRLFDRIERFEYQKQMLLDEINLDGEKYQFESLSTSLLSGLSNQIKSVLNAWEYDDVESVSFSEDTTDFIINGNERNLSGKGYRALTYSSFVISLLRYCVINGIPHSGVVILDSPLCTLRSKHVASDDLSNSGDVIGDHMKDSFYDNLSRLSGEGQIIIFENDEPNSSTLSRLKHHKFTKIKSVGRYGFFPMN